MCACDIDNNEPLFASFWCTSPARGGEQTSAMQWGPVAMGTSAVPMLGECNASGALNESLRGQSRVVEEFLRLFTNVALPLHLCKYLTCPFPFLTSI